MSLVLDNPIIRGNLAINARPAVRAATTVAGTLASSFEAGDTIDGVSLVLGDRILIKNQASGIENGIYVVETTGAPTRAEDLDTGDNAASINSFVREGTTNGNSAWACTNAPSTATVGTDALVFTQYDVLSTLLPARGGTGVTTFGGVNTLLYTTAADTLASITSANNSILVTNGSGVPSISSTLPSNLVLGSPALIDDSDSSQQYELTGGALTAGGSANSTITLPDDGGAAFSDVFTLNTRTQTLTNKTLTSAIVDTSLIFDEATNDLTVVANDQATAAATLTLPDLGGVGGDVTVTNLAQTLSNKELTTPSINGDVTFVETTNNLVLAVTDQTSAVSTLTVPDFAGVSQTLTLVDLAQTLTNKTFRDNSMFIEDEVDTTKIGVFDIGTNVPTATTVTLNFPDTGGIIATQAYVDSIAQGLDVKESVVAKTTALLSVTASGSGVGKTLTNTSNGAISGSSASFDGVTLVLNDRVLVDNEAYAGASSNLGIYTVTDVGSAGTPWVLTRATDADDDAEVTSGMFTFVTEGTLWADSGWILTTNDPITVDTTALSFTQFSSAGQSIAGDGLTKTGNTIDVGSSTTIDTTATTVFVNSSNTANQILLSSGTAGTEATFGALPLGNSNSVTGTLAVVNGGTGVTTFGGVNTILYTTAADTLANITTANNSILVTNGSGVPSMSSTLPANLTLGSPTLLDDSDSSQQYEITGGALTAGGSANSTVTLPADGGAAYSDVFTLNARTQTLTNKTLTSPIINQITTDGTEEILIFSDAGAAVNEFTIANAITATNPVLSATGGDTNIGLDFQNKGTGVYRFLSTADTAAELRLFEDTDDGSNYVGLRAGTIGTSLTFTLPVADGSNGDILQTNGSGALSFVTPSNGRVSYQILNQQAQASSTSYSTIGYFSWDNSRYSSYTSGALIFEVVIGNRDLDIRLRDTTSAATVVESTGINASAFTELTGFTNPSADGRLELQVRKSANGGSSPQIYGCQLEWSPS